MFYQPIPNQGYRLMVFYQPIPNQGYRFMVFYQPIPNQGRVYKCGAIAIHQGGNNCMEQNSSLVAQLSATHTIACTHTHARARALARV